MTDGAVLPKRLRTQGDGLGFFGVMIQTTGEAINGIQKEGFPGSTRHWSEASEALFKAEESETKDDLQTAYEALRRALEHERWLRN